MSAGELQLFGVLDRRCEVEGLRLQERPQCGGRRGQGAIMERWLVVICCHRRRRRCRRQWQPIGRTRGRCCCCSLWKEVAAGCWLGILRRCGFWRERCHCRCR